MANEKRLIDANELVSLMKYYDEQQLTDMWETSEIENLLDEIPTVQAVEVVCCKDCKRCKHYGDYVYGCRGFGMMKVNPYGFCSYGERRTE